MRTFLILCALLLCSCTTDKWGTVGESAAAQMHETQYLQFQHHGKPDTAAFSYYENQWYVYHPEFGTRPLLVPGFFDRETIPKHVILAMDEASGPLMVMDTPKTLSWQPLQNGCWPRAKTLVNKYGGTIGHDKHHAWWIPPSSNPRSLQP